MQGMIYRGCSCGFVERRAQEFSQKCCGGCRICHRFRIVDVQHGRFRVSLQPGLHPNHLMGQRPAQGFPRQPVYSPQTLEHRDLRSCNTVKIPMHQDHSILSTIRKEWQQVRHDLDCLATRIG